MRTLLLLTPNLNGTEQRIAEQLSTTYKVSFLKYDLNKKQSDSFALKSLRYLNNALIPLSQQHDMEHHFYSKVNESLARQIGGKHFDVLLVINGEGLSVTLLDSIFADDKYLYQHLNLSKHPDILRTYHLFNKIHTASETDAEHGHGIFLPPALDTGLLNMQKNCSTQNKFFYYGAYQKDTAALLNEIALQLKKLGLAYDFCLYNADPKLKVTSGAIEISRRPLDRAEYLPRFLTSRFIIEIPLADRNTQLYYEAKLTGKVIFSDKSRVTYHQLKNADIALINKASQTVSAQDVKFALQLEMPAWLRTVIG